MSDSFRLHGLQHSKFHCPSPTSRACSNSCPLSRWCHPTISSSVIPFSSYLQSFPAWGSFLTTQPFTSGGQIIGSGGDGSVVVYIWQSSLNCKLATDTFYCIQMVPQESWLKMDGRLPSAEVFSTQQLRNGLTEAHPGTFQLPCLSVNVSFYPLRPGEASRDIVKTWRPQGDIKTTPTTSAPAFSPGSYGTLKLWGRFKFCRISSFCFSWKITVIVKSTQELYEFKKLPMSPITFPKVTHIHNILYVWKGEE